VFSTFVGCVRLDCLESPGASRQEMHQEHISIKEAPNKDEPYLDGLNSHFGIRIRKSIISWV